MRKRLVIQPLSLGFREMELYATERIRIAEYGP